MSIEALLSWWTHVKSLYPRDPSIPVLRTGRFEVTAGDLDSVCELIKSRVPSGHTEEVPELPDDPFDA